MIRTLALLAIVATSLLALVGDARAYCRRTTSAWAGRSSIRVVIHPEAQDFIRHPFINPSTMQADDGFACTSSSQCGTDGLCASGFPASPASRCRGRRWTRSELERAVLWVVGRINHDAPAGIPFMYVDLNNSETCQIDEVCNDADRPWMNCFQHDTIVILPSECDGTDMIGATWTGIQWIDNGGPGSTHQMVRLQWSGSPRSTTWEFDSLHTAQNLPFTLLHEIGHGLGLGHMFRDTSSNTAFCVPDVTAAPGVFHPLCPSGAFGTCSVMSGDPGFTGGQAGLNQHYYGLDDIEGLVALFGLDSMPDTRLYEDCDISTPSFVEWSTTDLPLITDVASAPNFPLSGAGALALGGRLRDPLYQERFQLWEWNYSTLATTLVASVDTPGFRSTGAVGVSVSPTHRALSTLPVRLSGDGRHWRRQVRLVRREIAGGGQTSGTLNPASGTRADTPTPGVSSSYYQPLDAWLHAFRDQSGQVLLVAWRPVYGWSNVIETNVRSFAPPSIACSPTRCLVALVETPTPVSGSSTSTRLQWMEGVFAFASGTLVYNSPGALSLETSYFNVVSDPVASAVLKPDGTWYFYVATSWPQYVSGAWGTRVLTYRHAQNTTGQASMVQMTPLLEHSPGVAVQPTAAATGSCAELFTWRSP